MSKRLTTEEFIIRAKYVHGDKYDYSLSEYKSANEKLTIVCKKHGNFTQSAYSHLMNRGCPECGKVKRYKTKSKNRIEIKTENLIQPIHYKLIPLGNNVFAKVDNEDFERVCNINWCLSNKSYAINDKHGRMHRFIMNAPKSMFVDHINHDKLDNRKSNLRLCTKAQNEMNKKKRDGKYTSKFKGVHFDTYTNMWFCKVANIYSKKFKTEEEAAKEYDKKAKELFGEFAYLNFK